MNMLHYLISLVRISTETTTYFSKFVLRTTFSLHAENVTKLQFDKTRLFANKR